MHKFIFSTLLFTISYFSLYGQISFEEGYFIDNNGLKTDCFIKNIQWRNNPENFTYRLRENSSILTGDIKDVAEFGIKNDIAKFKRFKVRIDRSSDLIDDLSDKRKADFKEETIFLKTIIEGKATLYRFNQENLDRYFFSVGGSNPEQLVYKRFVAKDKKIAKNLRYKQQLINNLECGKPLNLNNLSYHQNQLAKLFINYNKCSNTKYVRFNKRSKKDAFNLVIKPGINFKSLSISDTDFFSGLSTVDFGSKPGISVGMAGEFIFGFNNNKWSALIEPTYQSFKDKEIIKGTTPSFDDTAEVTYSSIEVPVGIRYYMFLNKDSKIFINSFLVYDISLESKVLFERYNDLESKFNSWNSAFGIGFSHKKINAEIRYSTKRDILIDTPSTLSNYKGVSIILGFELL